MSKKAIYAAMAVFGAMMAGPLWSRAIASVRADCALDDRRSVEEVNRQVAIRYIGAIGSGNLSAARELLADEMRWVIPEDPSTSDIAGSYDKAAILKKLADFGKAMPNGVTFAIVDTTAEGDRVAIEATSKAETPNGQFRNQYHFLFVIRNGRIVLGKEYADSLFMDAFRRKLHR